MVSHEGHSKRAGSPLTIAAAWETWNAISFDLHIYLLSLFGVNSSFSGSSVFHEPFRMGRQAEEGAPGHLLQAASSRLDARVITPDVSTRPDQANMQASCFLW